MIVVWPDQFRILKMEYFGEETVSCLDLHGTGPVVSDAEVEAAINASLVGLIQRGVVDVS
jgi:hypothetical protein